MHWTYDVDVDVVVVVAVQKYMLHIDGVILILIFLINSYFVFVFVLISSCVFFSVSPFIGMWAWMCACCIWVCVRFFSRIYFANACSSMIYHCCMTSISIYRSLSLTRRTECTSGDVLFCMNTAHSFELCCCVEEHFASHTITRSQ